MAHIGLLCTPGSGQYNSVIPLGQELQQRGHRVFLCSFPEVEAVAVTAKLEFISVLPPDCNLGASGQAPSQFASLSGLAYLRKSCELGQPLFRLRLQGLPAALKAANVDFLVINSMVLDGSSVAEALGLPFVTVFSSLMPAWDMQVPPFTTPWRYERNLWAMLRNAWGYRRLRWALQPFLDVIAEYRQQEGLQPIMHPNQYFSSLAQISQQPPALEYPDRALPEYLHFTGPHHSLESRPSVDFPWDRLGDRPLIYASMGTNTNRHFDVYCTIAQACEPLDVKLVIALGGAAEPETLPSLPGNPLVVRYAPQLDILNRAALMISHGGMNSTLECLARSVPMVIIPIALDQPGVAARIAWAGAGEFILLNQLNVDGLRLAIQKVLTQPSYKENSRRLQQSIQQAGGVTRAIDIVEQVLAAKKLS
ncbi:MAG: glycosyltransferase [Cyanothece sp. SIO2G6]|nr:glycosyltransferase [Cyanothece sp. SIO2G6]